MTYYKEENVTWEVGLAPNILHATNLDEPDSAYVTEWRIHADDKIKWMFRASDGELIERNRDFKKPFEAQVAAIKWLNERRAVNEPVIIARDESLNDGYAATMVVSQDAEGVIHVEEVSITPTTDSRLVTSFDLPVDGVAVENVQTPLDEKPENLGEWFPRNPFDGKPVDGNETWKPTHPEPAETYNDGSEPVDLNVALDSDVHEPIVDPQPAKRGRKKKAPKA